VKKSYRFTHNESSGNEKKYVNNVLKDPNSFDRKIYDSKCREWFKQTYNNEFFLTPSCTKALEFAASLLDLQIGDEVILPTFTHVSTANAFTGLGVELIFIDVNPDNMVIDPELIARAMSDRTKAVVVTNYGGFSCELDMVKDLTEEKGIYLIEDNAHGILSYYKDRLLGSYGDLSCFSFEKQKNVTCGEGGGLLINNRTFIEKAKIIYNGGTDSEAFYLGTVDEYSWKGAGTKYGLSELAAAYLLGQLERVEEIIANRKSLWRTYFQLLKPLEDSGYLRIPHSLTQNEHNGHIFFVLANSEIERKELIKYLKEKDVEAFFHYVPLHRSDFGVEVGSYIGPEDYSGKLYRRLVRLPIHSGLDTEDIEYISSLVRDYLLT